MKTDVARIGGGIKQCLLAMQRMKRMNEGDIF